jgi:hypothetical protein
VKLARNLHHRNWQETGFFLLKNWTLNTDFRKGRWQQRWTRETMDSKSHLQITPRPSVFEESRITRVKLLHNLIAIFLSYFLLLRANKTFISCVSVVSGANNGVCLFGPNPVMESCLSPKKVGNLTAWETLALELHNTHNCHKCASRSWSCSIW